MKKKLIIWIALIAASTFWIGCGESPAPPPKAKIIRKKIAALPPEIRQNEIADSTQPTGDGGDLIAQNAADASSPDREPSSSQPNEASTSEEELTKDNGELSEAPGEETRDTSDQSETAVSESRKSDGTTDTSDEQVASISDIGGSAGSEDYIAYARTDRIDPFVPLFKEEPETEKEPEKTTTDDGKPKPPPRRLTPLEKLDLSQLKLVGIVRTPNGNKAMVEEASGKGYIIDKGTYIGIHSGQVVEIQKDRIVVEEKDKDQAGKVTVRTREIKFQRPSGDEYYEM